MMRNARLALPAVLILATALAACQSSTAPEKPVQPLGTAELRATLLEHGLARSGGTMFQRWAYLGLHHDDGTMTGRISWSDGHEEHTGVWDVTSDGLYCRTWSNQWAGGKRGCFRVSGNGETLVFDHVSGASGDADRYTYSLAPRTGTDQ